MNNLLRESAGSDHFIKIKMGLFFSFFCQMFNILFWNETLQIYNRYDTLTTI